MVKRFAEGDFRRNFEELRALTRPAWVPCSERMPEDGYYLVTNGKAVWTAELYQRYSCWQDDREALPLEAVTHWMPVPAPPRQRTGMDSPEVTTCSVCGSVVNGDECALCVMPRHWRTGREPAGEED